MNHNIDELREKASRLPLLPGVYIMLDSKEEIIYIGKAKKLKNRVSSYFHGEHLPKVAAMVDKVSDFKVIVAGSEFEALVLENSLIKQHKPHYNILLKDDKGFPFITMSKTEYPVLSLANKVNDKNLRYFGPFGSRGQSFSIISTVKKTFLLPDCSRVFPRDIGKERPCLNYQLGNCAGWCTKTDGAYEYNQIMLQVAQVLQGHCDELIENLTIEMEKAAEELRIEQAAAIRDKLRAVQGLNQHQRVIATAFSDTDVIGFCRGAKSCFTILHYNKGALTGKDTELLDDPLEDDDEALTSLLCSYYLSERASVPQIIVLPFELDESEDISRLFEERCGHRVTFEVPKRGERYRLRESAQLNAREEIERHTTVEQRRKKTLEWLQKSLDMDVYPFRIEAFDISNLSSTGIVAAMTVHIDGKPARKEYRKFRMKDLDGQDDYASMHQAVFRRFKRYIDGDPKFSDLPDLLLIDGGAVHAGIAESALSELGLILPVFGMVKDDRHRTRALIDSAGREISISTNQAVFSLIGNIQEETHRTAITYQRSLRNEAVHSSLDSIPGVGPKRREMLLKHFKTVHAISDATIEQLTSAVPVNVAEAVYSYYHKVKE